jgi:hypothetical protein
MKETPYHTLLGRDFLHHRIEVAKFVSEFHRSATQNGPIRMLYFEMNEFELNPARWYFNGFAYEKGGDIWDLTWNSDWLSDYVSVTQDFNLTGMELVQEAFASLYLDEDQPLGTKIAEEIAIYLVVARFSELIKMAHQIAKEYRPELHSVPIFSTAHDWDRLCPSK